ncbi:glycosyltransferase family 4 protein [Neolewinella aurantiaca]|uniref:Glycosyltransferase family 4 protein n=1 Tax=Neolewinella aurantiaca TaxID=2602767 RepID=A0A5C7FG25_9BACT|nr:glycosyltransferase [Neolewinella aurantiaca]TXF85224.1 glycosyltransferase family 4 protein [Neolewinella aurantiaca]
MKIAILAPLRFPIAEPFAGGLEIHTHLLARGLAERGHEVTLFAHPASSPDFEIVPCRVDEKAGFLTYTRAIRAAIRRIAEGNYDLVHNNSIHFLPPMMAAGLPFPMVTTLHTPPYKSHRFTAGLTRRIRNHSYVAISHFLGGQWKSLIGEYYVVHNGIETGAWPFSAIATKKSAVWYGRFTPEKGAEFAIAAAQAAGYQLTLAGPVYDQKYFDEKVAPGLGGNITYAGHLNQTDLAVLVGRSAVGLVTSVWDEPFGLAYAEMLACGTPVAGFESGAAAEIITEETGILVDKYDVEALAQVLAKVERSKDRKTCRKRITDAFPSDAMVAGYEAVYREVVFP